MRKSRVSLFERTQNLSLFFFSFFSSESYKSKFCDFSKFYDFSNRISNFLSCKYFFGDFDFDPFRFKNYSFIFVIFSFSSLAYYRSKLIRSLYYSFVSSTLKFLNKITSPCEVLSFCHNSNFFTL